MTDNEIKKALECCVGDNDGKNCFGCPLWEIDGCQEQLLLDALGIINRLQVNNERLTTAHPKTIESIKKMRDKAKAEAYKEFAERLKEYINGITERHEMPMFPFSSALISGVKQKIDNLVKEMVGEQNG